MGSGRDVRDIRGSGVKGEDSTMALRRSHRYLLDSKHISGPETPGGTCLRDRQSFVTDSVVDGEFFDYHFSFCSPRSTTGWGRESVSSPQESDGRYKIEAGSLRVTVFTLTQVWNRRSSEPEDPNLKEQGSYPPFPPPPPLLHLRSLLSIVHRVRYMCLEDFYSLWTSTTTSPL